MTPDFDLLIIGGGPAGVAAGVYAARKQLKTIVVAEEFGGQSTVSEGIENWIGTVKISGAELGKQLKTHLEAYKGDIVKIEEGTRVEKLEKVAGDLSTDAVEEIFKATTKNGKEITARAVLIASGAGRRKLVVPGADVFEHKGLTYCASCDGPLFADADVVVIGGGNAAFESALQLLAYAKSVTLINRSTEFKADPITVERVRNDPKMTILTQIEPVEVKGDKFVNGLVIKDVNSGEMRELAVTGIFVEIGVIPSTDFAKGVVELDAINRVVTNPKNQHTSTDGIWAAGDCTDELYHQNNIAAGDAVKALEDIYLWLKTHN